MIRSRTAGSIVIAALFVSLLISVPSPGIRSLKAQESEVTLTFSIKEGEILKYKGSTTTETNFKGFLINSVHHDDVELSLVEVLEDQLQRIAIKYVDCSDRRSMGGAPLEDFASPIKPKGKTIKMVIRPNGAIEDVQGFIMGINSRIQLDRYVDKWILELPEGPVTKGSKWTRQVPREEKEAGEEEDPYQVKGTVEFELKKFGEE
ncbi:MAG TPA: hypothetical protein VLA34_00650, partial [Candidatus Krumholzibacterium sp.]|nr:hypothetical protein [Candidatus Krumholzibacterium sp.]